MAGPTVFNGTSGPDRIVGSPLDDALFGFEGNDILDGREGDDLLDGGPDADTAYYGWATNPVSVILAPAENPFLKSGTATGIDIGNDTLIDIENVIGGAGNDSLRGSAGFNILAGRGGDDTLQSWASGIDRPLSTGILIGGGGSDRLIAASGDLLWGGDQGMQFHQYGRWSGPGAGAVEVYAGDFNGDGKSDVFGYVPGVSGVNMFLSDGGSFQHAGNWTGAGPQSWQGWKVGDFDGDGKDDVFRYVPGVSGADMFLSTGTGLDHVGSWTGAGTGIDGWFLGDFDGDGRTDIFRYLPGASGADVFLSTGSSFADGTSWTGAGYGSDGWYVGDFDGDGRTDVFRYVPGVSGADMFLSTGSSFAQAGSWTLAGHEPGTRWQVGDFNGDGKADIGRQLAEGGFEVFLSTGSSFESAGIATKEPGSFVIANFDGHGGDDLLRFDEAGSATDVFLGPLLGLGPSGPDGSDTFVFGRYGWNGLPRNDLSQVRIMDFKATGPDHDVIEIQNGLFRDFDQVMANSRQEGDHVVITYTEYSPGGQIRSELTLENVLLSDLSPSDFIFAV